MNNVSFSNQDIKQAEELAAARTAQSKLRGYKDRRGYFADAGDALRQVKSYLAEIAVAIYLGVAPQVAVGQVGRADLVTPEYKVEVKSSSGNCLHVEPCRLEHEFWYALVNVDLEAKVANVRGFIKGEDITSLVDYGNGRPPVLKACADRMKRLPEPECPF